MQIIANPTSRSGRGRQLWQSWRQSLQTQAIPCNWHVSASEPDCIEQARLADNTAVAVGGDGTINAVLNGVMRANAPKRMGVLYAGTSPDFCRFHHIPVEPQAALQTLLNGQTRQVDVGLVCHTDDNGNSYESYFASSCNIGIGSTVAAFANRHRRYWGDTLGTGLGLLKALLVHRPFGARLELDGNHFTFERVNHIIIMKNPYIASGLKVNAELLPDDGKLLAIVIHGYARLALFKLVAAFYKGTLLQKPGVFAHFCHTAAVTPTTRQPLEFDGDPHGFAPATITLKPKALSLICGGAYA